ncbi:MAG: glycosyltransferase family 2 protein [Rhodopirellula sp.]|nr:glycosyltransferase family 2 protein [Rhodopirellula sp.]
MAVLAFADDASGPRREISVRVEMALFAAGFLSSLGVLLFVICRSGVWPSDFGGNSAPSFSASAGRVFFALVAVLSGCRGAFFIGLSFLARREHLRQRQLGLSCSPYVSILVPCFNEGETIGPAMESLLELDYPSYEVLVINDGSTDDTFWKAKQYEGKYGGVSVRVFDKPNGGKWSALNYAFQRASGELMLCVDADSRLEEGALRRMVCRLGDPKVAAVAGQVRVRNRHNLITQLQALEYQMGNGAVRMGQSLFGTVLVIAGPLGLFRRSVMEDVLAKYNFTPYGHPGRVTGPYEGDTFAEDFDLSMAILSLGGRIVYEPDAVSLTKAPDRAFTLINQRYRWLRGSFQVLRKFIRRSRNEKGERPPRRIGAWICLTYLPDLTLMPAFYVVGLTVFLTLAATSGTLPPALAIFAALLLVQSCIAAFFLSMHRDSLRLLKVLPLLDVYCGILLGSAWLISVVDELRGSKMRW